MNPDTCGRGDSIRIRICVDAETFKSGKKSLRIQKYPDMCGYTYKLPVILYENCSANCYCNFNPCGVFEKMMSSFTQILNEDLEQGKLMPALNSLK